MKKLVYILFLLLSLLALVDMLQDDARFQDEARKIRETLEWMSDEPEEGGGSADAVSQSHPTPTLR